MSIFIVSKSDMKKIARGGKPSNRSFVVLDGEEIGLNKRISGYSGGTPSLDVVSEELDLREGAGGYSSDNQIFAVLNEEESNLDERPGAKFPTHLAFAILYLGLFIGFLITTIAVDMASNKHKVFLTGTILFGAIALCLFMWWLGEQYKCIKQIENLPTHDETVQID